MRDVKTIALRVLVPTDVDEGDFVEQLVEATYGPGAPVAAVQLQHNSHGDLVPVWGRVVARPRTEELSGGWTGERVEPRAPVS